MENIYIWKRDIYMETRYIYGNEIYIWKRDIYGNVVKIINVEIRKGKEEALFFTPLSLEPDNIDLWNLITLTFATCYSVIQ